MGEMEFSERCYLPILGLDWLNRSGNLSFPATPSTLVRLKRRLLRAIQLIRRASKTYFRFAMQMHSTVAAQHIPPHPETNRLRLIPHRIRPTANTTSRLWKLLRILHGNVATRAAPSRPTKSTFSVPMLPTLWILASDITSVIHSRFPTLYEAHCDKASLVCLKTTKAAPVGKRVKMPLLQHLLLDGL